MSKSKLLKAGRPSAQVDKAATLASLQNDIADMKRVNFELSAELHANLKVYSARTGKSIKDLLTEYIATLPEA